jgi:predicted RNase H-like HicB family nuclease/DNA-binding XRE family transcriptional regulator
MQYPAIITQEGKRILAEFPDCPGCATFAEPGEDILALAQEALTGWLEAHLEDGAAPPRPTIRRRWPRGSTILLVSVPVKLAVALSVRWARQDAGLSQGELAEKMGVSQQQAAKLEQPEANPSVATLAKVARALQWDLDLQLVPRPQPSRTKILSFGARNRAPARK